LNQTHSESFGSLRTAKAEQFQHLPGVNRGAAPDKLQKQILT